VAVVRRFSWSGRSPFSAQPCRHPIAQRASAPASSRCLGFQSSKAPRSECESGRGLEPVLSLPAIQQGPCIR
jgi:hypothetical protein